MEHSHIRCSNLPVGVKVTDLRNTPLTEPHRRPSNKDRRLLQSWGKKDSILQGQFIPSRTKCYVHYKEKERERKKNLSLDKTSNKRKLEKR